MDATLYLDHNASSPLRATLRAHLREALEAPPVNPGSVHQEGQRARALLENARRRVRRALGGGGSGRVVFTGSATEANALALHRTGPVACSRLEHPSVLAPVQERPAPERLWLEHDAHGAPCLPATPPLKGTQLVAMLANNELGVRSPIEAFATYAREHGLALHVDAAQVVGRWAWEIPSGVTSVTLSAHKAGGPVGIGALWFAEGHEAPPMLSGGHQERGARAGTENVLFADAWGALLHAGPDPAWSELEGVRDAFEAAMIEQLGAVANGVDAASGESSDVAEANRIPNTSNLSIPGIDAETALMALDLDGICASAGSACTAGSIDPSPTLRALGLEGWRLHNALRFSFGPEHAGEDGAALAARVIATLERARSRTLA